MVTVSMVVVGAILLSDGRLELKRNNIATAVNWTGMVRHTAHCAGTFILCKSSWS